MRRWAGGLALAVVLGQVGCGSSGNKGSPSATDASENDVSTGETDGGNEGTPEGSAPAAEAGADSTVATVTDAEADSTVTSNTDAANADAANTDAATEASAPWSPSSLTGLALWLDGHHGLGLTDGGTDAGDGGPAIEWLDQSGNGNNAIGYGTPAIHPTAVDGQPAVHFGGTDYLLVQDSTSLDWGTSDFVVAIVVQHTTPVDAGTVPYGTLYSKQIADVAPYTGVGLFANTPERTTAILEQLNEYGTSEITSTTSGYNDGVPFLVVIHRAAIPIVVDGGADAAALDAATADASALDATAGDAGDAGEAAPTTTGSMTMLINSIGVGYDTGAGYAGNVSSTDYPARIGGTQGGQDLVGDIAEVIAVQGTVSATELADLQAYLMNKYGL